MSDEVATLVWLHDLKEGADTHRCGFTNTHEQKVAIVGRPLQESVLLPFAAAKCTGVAPSEVLQVMGQFAERTSQWVTLNLPVWAAACSGVMPSVDAS